MYRDLHCWEMMMDWVPYGPRKSYNFTIRIKSSILKDLKSTEKAIGAIIINRMSNEYTARNLRKDAGFELTPAASYQLLFRLGDLL